MESSVINSQSYLTFKLDKEIFGSTVNRVSEIVEVPKITKVPKAPEYMRGVINLRGKVLPVIDTRIKFGMTSVQDTVDTCIVVLDIEMEGENITIGALVDGVSEVLTIDDSRIESAPSLGNKYKSEVIDGMYKHDEDFIMLLNIDKVFSGDEVVLLAESAETEKNEAKKKKNEKK